MFGDTAQRSGGLGEEGRRSGRRRRGAGRSIRAAGLAALAAAGLLAATASGSPPPSGGATVFVHSATSGELGGGRLILHGVGRRVSWAHDSGRSGVMAVKPMHRALFKPGSAAVTAILHVAGHRGGDEPTFELTKPLFNAARHTVSYRIKRLGDGRLPGRAARAAGQPSRRSFGVASLSMVGAASHFSAYQYACEPHKPRSAQCVGIRGQGLYPGSQVIIGSTTYTADSNGAVDVPAGGCPLKGTLKIQAEDSNKNPINTFVSYPHCLGPSPPPSLGQRALASGRRAGV
jgi:hypothetical protein